jgi:hypothetical protein
VKVYRYPKNEWTGNGGFEGMTCSKEGGESELRGPALISSLSGL